MKHCLLCHKEISDRKNYCNNACHMAYRRNKARQEWLDGEDDVHPKTLKKYLIEVFGHQCNKCKNTEWNGQPIPLETEHKDGNSENNRPENLCLLCPNCHAQTPTYKARNIGNGRHFRRQRYKEGKSF